MILRPLCTLPPVVLSILFLSLPFVLADDTPPSFDCRVTVNGMKFDLNTVAGEYIVNHTRNLPPSTVVESLRFNLCDDLKKLEGLADRDQCKPGTRACLTQTNKKSEETDRVVSVIPLMQTSSLNLTYESGLSSPKFLSVTSYGPEYPHPIDSTPTAQTLIITLFCNLEEKIHPTFKSYNGSQMQVEWNTPAGCPLQEKDGPEGGDSNDSDKKPNDKKRGSTGSGVGWFFFMLVFTSAAYLGIGAYYNYATYGARGADLIPHRDFWKEVPYMFWDVVSHLCSAVRPRHASSHGYIAV